MVHGFNILLFASNGLCSAMVVHCTIHVLQWYYIFLFVLNPLRITDIFNKFIELQILGSVNSILIHLAEISVAISSKPIFVESWNSPPLGILQSFATLIFFLRASLAHLENNIKSDKHVLPQELRLVHYMNLWTICNAI